MKTTLGMIRRADEEYNMIQPGDKVAVGVSGGKDSLLLLHAMSLYRRVRHEDFDLCGIMLTTGKEKPDTSAIEAMAAELNVPLLVRHTELYEILFEIRKDPNPCALCAKMRRAMLCDASKEMGANKLALGHHREDAEETLLMSLLYEGRISCFQPVTDLDRTGIIQIRPMLYIHEKTVDNFAVRENLPVIENRCPVDKTTKREEIKDLIFELAARYPDLKERIFGAMQRYPLPEWEPKGRYKRPKNTE